MSLSERAALARGHDLTLGTLLERLGRLRGDRRLVDEPGDGLHLTFTEGADVVARVAAGVAAKALPGDRVVVAAPNGYEPTSPEARAALEALVMDSYAWFKGMVRDRRKLDGTDLDGARYDAATRWPRPEGTRFDPRGAHAVLAP